MTIQTAADKEILKSSGHPQARRIAAAKEANALIRAAADADRKAAAEYRALQDATMRENRETSRKMVRGY